MVVPQPCSPTFYHCILTSLYSHRLRPRTAHRLCVAYLPIDYKVVVHLQRCLSHNHCAHQDFPPLAIPKAVPSRTASLHNHHPSRSCHSLGHRLFFLGLVSVHSRFWHVGQDYEEYMLWIWRSRLVKGPIGLAHIRWHQYVLRRCHLHRTAHRVLPARSAT